MGHLGQSIAKSDRTRPHHRPATRVICKVDATFPWAGDAGLTTGMGNLDARDRAMLFQEASDPLQRCDVFVGPDPRVPPGEIRPSAETAVASAMTNPAPPAARAPRWTKCQSVATPSSEEYMHIGETPTRFRKVIDLIVSGSKR